jgi:hypothetical protein
MTYPGKESLSKLLCWAALVGSALTPGCAAPGANIPNENTSYLLNLLESGKCEDIEDCFSLYRACEQASMEAGEDAIPFLTQAIASGRDPKVVRRAGGALTVIGGPVARDYVRNLYSANPEVWKIPLSIVSSSVGDHSDVLALENVLKTPDFVFDGEPFWIAPDDLRPALWALGVIRSSEALDTIDEIARTSQSNSLRRLAEEMRRWIVGGNFDIDPGCLKKEEGPLEGVFRCGIFWEGSMYEPENGRVWSLNGTKWSCSADIPASPQEKFVSFYPYVTRAGDRAFVDVQLQYPQHGYYQRYSLRLKEGRWLVTGIVETKAVLGF